jgi:hypothetical protein
MRVETALQYDGRTRKMYVDHDFGYPDEELQSKGLPGDITFKVFWGHESKPHEEIGWFTLSPLPGCCGVVVSTGSYLKEGYRGNHNFGIWFHEIKQMMAQKLGYKIMLMTTQLRNIPEVVGACRAKWKIFHCFRNKRTDNDIGIAFKEI